MGKFKRFFGTGILYRYLEDIQEFGGTFWNCARLQESTVTSTLYPWLLTLH